MKHYLKQITLGAVLGLAMVASGTLATPAQAVTLDFQSLVSVGAATNAVADPYMEDGFQITASLGTSMLPVTLVSHGTLSPHFAGIAPGGTGLGINNFDATATLTKTVGLPAFSLISIDLADFVSGLASNTVTFTAQLTGGGTTMQSFTPMMGLSYETFNFNSSFNNIVSVSWDQGNPMTGAHQFDNIVVGAPVPEPSTMLLFGSGLAGIVGWRYRKQNA